MPSQLLAQWVESQWGAEQRVELGPVLQQASRLPTEPRCIPFLYLGPLHTLYT
jgi:hypothetical protein